MTKLLTQVAENAKFIDTNSYQRGASIVRVCGEEHSGRSIYGEADMWLTCDNDLCFVSDYKFKLVFNNGENAQLWVDGAQPTAPWSAGKNKWATLEEFKAAYPLGSFIVVNDLGAQCVSYAQVFWLGQTGRGLDCGRDNARGIWTRRKMENAGGEFDLIYNWSDVRKGDWIVTTGGSWGHIALAVENPVGNSVKVWNQNVSGKPYYTGGKALSEDTLTNSNFGGAFRYHGPNWP